MLKLKDLTHPTMCWWHPITILMTSDIKKRKWIEKKTVANCQQEIDKRYCGSRKTQVWRAGNDLTSATKLCEDPLTRVSTVGPAKF